MAVDGAKYEWLRSGLVFQYWLYTFLVGGFNPSEQMKVSLDGDIPNIWKVIKAMFQTTNQIYMYSIYIYIFIQYNGLMTHSLDE